MPASTSPRRPEAVAAKLREYSELHPSRTRLVQLGVTHQGRGIFALAIAEDLLDDDPRPAVLLNGAHHGGELLSIDVVLDAIAQLLEAAGEADARLQRFLRELVIWCVPEVNPDGVEAILEDAKHSDRKNARDNNQDGKLDETDGVDLNRNYPFRWGALGEKGSSARGKSVYYRGPAPASEPETQAMMELARRERFCASISYHTGTVAILAPYTIPEVKNPEPNEAWQVGEWLAARLPRHPQDREFVLKKNLYPVDGTDQDWLRHELGTLALIVESARGGVRGADERAAIVRVVRNTWLHLFERFLDGPSLSGRIINDAGQPVSAEVRIVEQTLREGEVWTSRPRDGRFDRFLPGPGSYTVQARLEGFAPVEQSVELQDGRVEIELVIAGAPSSLAAMDADA
jgi:hypothetical protein